MSQYIGLPIMRLVFVVPLLLLAGCAGPTESGATTPDVVVITDPNDYSYVDQMTDGSGEHIHDYWNGQQTLPIVDADYSCMGCTRSSNGQDPATTVASFRPENPIPQGAAWVNVTPEYRFGASDAAGVELWVKTAADSEPWFHSQVTSGEMVTIDTTNEQDDQPHARLSAWEFLFLARSADGQSVEISDWSMSLTGYTARGHDIPPWPAHPDHWQGDDEKTLFAHRNEVMAEYALPMTHSCWGGCFDRPLDIDDGIIIPPDADRIEIVLRHESDIPLPFRLVYHGGDTWDLSEATATSSTPTQTTFVIEVDSGIADGAYALQSVWEFWVEPDMERPYAYSGYYTADGTVYRD